MNFSPLIRVFLSVLVFCFFFSCKKDNTITPSATLQLPTTEQVRSIFSWNNAYIITTGSTNGNGSIFKTTDFKTMELLYQDPNLGFYGIGKMPSGFIVGCHNVEMLFTNDFETFIPYYYERKYWINNQHKQPVRSFCQQENQTFAVASGNLSFGVAMHFDTLQQQFIPTEWENEIRDICFHPSKKEVVAVGNGIVLKWNPSNSDWDRLPSPDEFYTSILPHNNQYLATTLNGELHQLATENNAVSSVSSKSFEIGYKTLFHISTQNNNTLLTGSNGFYAIQENGDWKSYKLNTDEHFHTGIMLDGKVFLGGKGKIYQIN